MDVSALFSEHNAQLVGHICLITNVPLAIKPYPEHWRPTNPKTSYACGRQWCESFTYLEDSSLAKRWYWFSLDAYLMALLR